MASNNVDARTKLLGPTRSRTPEPPKQRKANIHPRLRKRLILSTEKNHSQQLGQFIAKRLKTLESFEKAVKVS
ncbi:hypothetical protein HUJ04_010621 [Dendroctonus ponderosae]|nr:hypothetical protein HUJ04_010621 [Dendroctonus ponderosae]KAH1027974.1 hypothetical protein HUJ05_001387 [Dendroctonus ponderosae]